MKAIIIVVLVLVYLIAGFLSQYFTVTKMLKATGITYWKLMAETFKSYVPLGAIGVIIGTLVWAVFWPLCLLGSFVSLIAMRKHFDTEK